MSPELLRAWERRYRLLEPTRSTGGLRLYSTADLDRVRAMQQHLAEGLAAAEAAALAAAAEPRADQAVAFSPAAARRNLDASLSGFDEARAHAVLDELLSIATLDSILSDVLIPFLRELGKRWNAGRSRSLRNTSPRACCAGGCSVSRAAGTAGSGRACCSPVRRASGTTWAWPPSASPSERGASGFSISAPTRRSRASPRQRALRIPTPSSSARSAPNVSRRSQARSVQLAAEYPVYLGGAGATAVGAEFPTLTGDPVEEADRFAALTQ